MAFKFDVNKEVTRSLKFKPNPNLNNLNLGKLINVEVVTVESPKIKEDGSESMFEYAGLEIPTLKLTFQNYVLPEDTDKADRFFIHVEKVIVSRNNKGENLTQKTLDGLYEQMWDRIKHIHDAFKGSANYLPFKELPEINEKADPEVRVKQFTKFFTTIADAFNNGKAGKIYEDEKGNPVIVWMKLVADYNQGTYLVFPTWPGEGFIEPYKAGVPPTIEVKAGERQTLSGGKKDSKSTTGAASDEADSGIPANLLEMINAANKK